MPSALLQPGVYIEEISSGVRSISGVATSIALFIGWAPRGPIDRAVRISSFADYERAYGGLDRRAYLGYAVRHFFDNGGSDAYIVRIAMQSDPAAPATDAATATCPIGDLNIQASSPGLWAHAYSVKLTLRADDVNRFQLDVLGPSPSTNVVETFQDLSMDKTDPRYAPSVINGRSAFMDKLTTASATVPNPASTPKTFSGGADGTVLAANDGQFANALDPLFATGGIIDRIDLFNLVCVPGLTNTNATTQGVLAKLQLRCHARRAFLIVDSLQNETVANMDSKGETGLTGSDGNFSALYYPWVMQADPLQSGVVRDFPPCGFVAGVYARTDATRGVWKAPAGIEASVNGGVGFALTLSDAENGALNPLGVNCLRTLPVYGNVVWGARTLDGAERSWLGMEIRAGAAHGAVHRGEPVSRHAMGGVRAERRAALGADPAQHRRLHAGPVPPGRVPGPHAARGLLRQVRQRDHDADRHQSRHRQHRRRLRAAEARRVRRHQDPADRRRHSDLRQET